MAEAKEKFDRVFDLVGSIGRFQIILLVLIAFQCIIMSWHHLSYVFLGAVPSHWCDIPELNGTDWTATEIMNFSIPRTKDNMDWESCVQFNRNYSHYSGLTYEEALIELARKNEEASISACSNGWKFNDSLYKSTLVTEFQTVCDDRYLTAMIQATYMCGVLAGSLILGSLSDCVIGRRKAILFGICLVEFAAIMAALSRTYTQMIFFRFLVAFGGAGAYQNCYVLLMEYTGTKWRSTMGMVQQLPFAFGYMLMAVYAYYIRDWHNLQLAFSLTGAVLFSYFWVLPESARWLAISGQPEKAVNVLMKVAKQNGKKNVIPSQIMDIIISCGVATNPKMEKRVATFTIAPPETEETKTSYVSSTISSFMKAWVPIKNALVIYLTLLATPQMRKRTLLLWYLFLAVDLVYYGVVFDSATLTNDPYMLVFLGGLSEVPAYTVVVPFLAKYGRRPTLMTMFFITSISTFAVAYLPADEEIFRTIVSMSGKLCITTCFAVIYLLGAELYPTETRTTGLAAGVFIGRIGSISAPIIVDRMKNVYRDMPSIIFGIVCLLSGIISILLPETNDIAMADQLSDVEQGHLPQQKQKKCAQEVPQPIPEPETQLNSNHGEKKSTVEQS